MAQTRKPRKTNPVAPIKVDDASGSAVGGVLTPDEMAIAQRIAAENNDWQTIGEDSAIDFSLMQDMFELPEEARKKVQNKEFAFRWIERTRQRIDQIRNKPVPFKWWLCNATTTPFLKKYVDPALGAVVREDQILVFRPWWMHEKEKAIKSELANVLDQSKRLEAHQGKEGGGADMQASSRPSNKGQASRMEVKGSDIIAADEGDPDSRIYVSESGEMSDSELIE